MTDTRSLLRRRRDLGEIIQDALQLYTQHFIAFFSIAAVSIPLRIATSIFAERSGSEVVSYLLAVPDVFVGEFVSAALIVAIRDIDGSRNPDFGRAFDTAIGVAASILGGLVRVVFHVLLFAVTIVGIPWAIQRLVRWTFTAQAVVLDGANARDSLSRSAAAVQGSWWRTLACLVAIGLPALLLGLTSVFLPAEPLAVTSTAAAGIGAMVLPFSVIAATMLYFDLNARKEPTSKPHTLAQEESA